MTLYHINKRGMAAKCKATQGGCPFKEHFDSIEDARKAYESVNETFTPNKFVKKKQPTQRTRVFNDFGSDGLTQNVEEFKNKLEDISRHIDQWAEYRRTGLDEDKYRPQIPESMSGYIQKNNFNHSLNQVDTTALKVQWADALKSYYMDKVFRSEDIDCLLDDDEINEILNIQ